MGRFFTSRRERRLWIGAAVAVVLIYLSLYFVRDPIEWLRERDLLRLTVAATFALTAAVIALWMARRRPGRAELIVLAVSAAAYAVALILVERHEERLHFLEYGVVGGLIYAALLERRDRAAPAPAPPVWAAAAIAVVLTGLAGWGDEGIQALLPNRVYELRDAGLNLVAGVMIVLAMTALRQARR